MAPMNYLGHGRCVYAYRGVIEMISSGSAAKTITDRFVVIKEYQRDNLSASARIAEIRYLRKFADVLSGEKNGHQIPTTNDFGFAVPASTEHVFAGTLRFAPTAVLRSYISNPFRKIVCECWQDLESAAKLLFTVGVTGLRSSPLFQIDASDAQKFLQYWESVEELMVGWLDAARASDYEALIDEVSRIITSL